MSTEKLKREDLWSLEQYSIKRDAFRKQVIEHKKYRRISLTEHARLYFEDRLTIQYQIQEMLRIEKVFEAEGIADELNAYNPLIPDGSNWKATFMLEYEDVEERKHMLAQLKGVEHKLWVEVPGLPKIYGIADEDLERSDETKTSSVHFVRFELTPAMLAALKEGSELSIGLDSPALNDPIVHVEDAVKKSLLADLKFD